MLTIATFAGEVKGIPLPAAGQQKVFKIVPHPGLLSGAKGTAEMVSEIAIAGGCICVILNTVRQAQEVYSHLKGRVATDDTILLLFHSRFRADRRQEIELPPGCVVVTREALQISFEKMLKRREDEEQKALRCLIPEPDTEYFTLARAKELPLDEGDSLAASYLHASTRLGGDTRQVLFLGGDPFRDEMERRFAPDKRELRQMMLQLAGILGWWLDGAVARFGCGSPAVAPRPSFAVHMQTTA